MPPNRRMGPKDSAVFNALLDAVEQVLQEDGYGAATSRRIATVAGLKQQLVYYYFETMDELLLATFSRRTERALSRITEVAASDEPIRALWNFLIQTANGGLGFEFVALANHHEGIRNEIARYVTEVRRIGGEAIARQLSDNPAGLPLRPEGLAFFMDCASLLLRREGDSGISAGHAEALEFVEWVLDRVSTKTPKDGASSG
jgi:AcrR family transcriptional regulator